MYLVYLLKSGNYSYVGMTNDFFNRFRQHNKEIKGGAKYTSKKDSWYPVLIIDGFPDKKSACQCEWRLKHFARGHGSIKGANNKIRYLSKFLNNEKEITGFNNLLEPIIQDKKWTTKCEKSIYHQNLTFYVDDDYISDFYHSPHNYTHKELYWKE